MRVFPFLLRISLYRNDFTDVSRFHFQLISGFDRLIVFPHDFVILYLSQYCNDRIGFRTPIFEDFFMWTIFASESAVDIQLETGPSQKKIKINVFFKKCLLAAFHLSQPPRRRRARAISFPISYYFVFSLHFSFSFFFEWVIFFIEMCVCFRGSVGRRPEPQTTTTATCRVATHRPVRPAPLLCARLVFFFSFSIETKKKTRPKLGAENRTQSGSALDT